MYTSTIVKSVTLHVTLTLFLSVIVQTASAQPGFGQEWQKTGVPLFSIIGMPGSWNGTALPAYDIIGHVMYDGTEYKSFVGGTDGSSFSAGLWTSTALESGWVAHPSNPILSNGPEGSWDEFSVANPMVLKDGGTYKMWYTGYDNANLARIGYASSTDGLVWEKSENNPVLDVSTNGWDTFHLHTPYVVKDGETYRMWYAGHDGGGGTWGIGYATSPDGMTWTRPSSEPVLVPEETWEFTSVHTPVVLVEEGKFLMWYGGQSGNLGTGGIVQTGFATSEDGMDWVKDEHNPVLKVGGLNANDEYVALALGVFKINATTYKMIYGANSSTFLGSMSATLAIPTAVEELSGSSTDFLLAQNYPNPFNPQTNIRFALPAPGQVSLKVFNLLGEEITTLVDEHRMQGQYNVSWLPDGLQSGLYVYRLQAGDFVSARTMLYLK